MKWAAIGLLALAFGWLVYSEPSDPDLGSVALEAMACDHVVVNARNQGLVVKACNTDRIEFVDGKALVQLEVGTTQGSFTIRVLFKRSLWQVESWGSEPRTAYKE